jgi:hypothetical protein
MLSSESLFKLKVTFFNRRQLHRFFQFFVLSRNFFGPSQLFFFSFKYGSLKSFLCLFELAHLDYFNKHVAEVDQKQDVKESESQVTDIVLIIIVAYDFRVERNKVEIAAQHDFVPYVKFVNGWLFKRLNLVYISYH